nr:hypothetical protein [uncultured Actinoplanes sp.]
MIMAMNDWERFLRQVTWFVQPGQTATPGDARPWDRPAIPGLPVLSGLLGSATLTPVSVAGSAYELLAWGPRHDRRGWLCRPARPGATEAVPELHKRFWEVCGGIIESFGAPVTWWMNQNEVLTAEAERESLADPLDAYAWIWEHEGLEIPIDPDDYYPAAVEANGNLTLAHRQDGGLLLFAPDHDFDGVTPLAGCPPCSLLTIDRVPDLATWIETCAAVWRQP